MDKGFVSEKQAAAALERAVAEGRVTPEEAEAARKAADERERSSRAPRWVRSVWRKVYIHW